MAVVVARSTGGCESASRKTISAPPDPAEPDLVAVHQDALGDLFTVDVGAVAGIPVLQLEAIAVDGDFGVVARHFAARQAQIVGFAAADFERALRNGDDAPSEGIGHFQAGVGHGLTV